MALNHKTTKIQKYPSDTGISNEKQRTVGIVILNNFLKFYQ